MRTRTLYMVRLNDDSWGDTVEYFDEATVLAIEYADMGDVARVYEVIDSLPDVLDNERGEDYGEEIDRHLLVTMYPPDGE